MKRRKWPRRMAAVCAMLLSCFLLSGCISQFMSADDKYIRYTKLNNRVVTQLEGNVASYIRHFGYTEEYTPGNNFVHFSVSAIAQEEFDVCDKVAEVTTKKPLIDPIDNLTAELASETKKLYNLFNDMADYYNDDDCLTDEFVKGKEYHQRFMALMPGYYTLFDEFSWALTGLDAEKLQQRFDKMTDKGYHYYAMKTMLDSYQVSKYLHDNDVTDKNILSADPTIFASLYEKVKESYTAYEAEIVKNGSQDSTIEKYIGMTAYCVGKLQLILQAQDVNVQIPEAPEKSIERESQNLPAADVDYYLAYALSYYNGNFK